jgi:hypothetical protein
MTVVSFSYTFHIVFFLFTLLQSERTLLQSLLTCTMYLQKFSEEELAEMPSCNLAETIHNKWL